MIFGIIYGILLAFILYFAALAFNLKSPAVIWFTVYIACLGLVFSCYQGYLQALLRPSFPGLNKAVLLCAIGFLYFVGAKFFRLFLNIASYSGRIDRILQLLQWMGIGFIPMNLFANPLTPLYGIVLIGIGPLFSTAVSIVFWIKRVPNARYFAIGWIIGHITSEVDLLRVMGVLPWTAGSAYLIPAGMISPIIFFSIAIMEQTRMYLEYANRDGLTGIANRRCFDETLTIEWNRHLRNRHPLSILLFDIDDFKAFNDTYGHFRGDACLKAVGEKMHKATRRAGDLTARYGGDEFITLLPETDASQASRLGETIRKAVEGLSIPHRASRTKDVITVSVGASTMIPEKRAVPSELINQADKSLYKAKSDGRNRVVSD
jgi:diguanylate cyclase (GGDEF)-like protein